MANQPGPQEVLGLFQNGHFVVIWNRRPRVLLSPRPRMMHSWDQDFFIIRRPLLSFRYNLPYSVTLGPQRHSFFRYPSVPIQPLGSIALPPEPSTTDTLLKWAFWVGAGFAAVQVFGKLTRKPILEMNARMSKAKIEALKAQALEMYVPGEPAGPLAEELGVSRQAIMSWMKDAGVYEPATRGPKKGIAKKEQLRQDALRRYVPGEPVAPLARDLGVSRSILTAWLKDAGVYESAPIGPSRDEQLFQEALSRYVSGEPVGPLARALGVSKRTIANWMKDAGVYVSARAPYLDEEKRDALFEAYTPASNLSKLARSIGISRLTAERWLREAGIYIPAPMGGVRGPVGFPDERAYRQLLDTYKPGMDVIALAKEVGISHKSAHRILKEEGVYEPKLKEATLAEKRKALLKAYKPTKNLTELAREIGVPPHMAAQWLKDADIYVAAPMGGVRGTRDEEVRRRALLLYVPGEPVGPLARELGVSRKTIVNWMKDAGVYERAPLESGVPSRDEQLFQEALSRYIPGEPVGPLARELGVSNRTIIRWMKAAGVYEPVPRARKKKQNPEPYAFGGW